MSVNPAPFDPNYPIPNGPFYSNDKNYLCGPYSPFPLGCGLCVNDQGTVCVTATGGVNQIFAGSNISLPTGGTGNVTISAIIPPPPPTTIFVDGNSNIYSCDTYRVTQGTLSNSIFLGNHAGIGIGNYSGGNVFVGAFTGCALGGFTGANTFIGVNAGKGSTTGENSTYVGANAGCAFTTGSRNVVLGSFTGAGFETCLYHTFISDGCGNNRLMFNNWGAMGVSGPNYGTSGQVLTSCGGGSPPVWTTPGSGPFVCDSNQSIWSTNTTGGGLFNLKIGQEAGLFTGTYTQDNVYIGRCSGRNSGGWQVNGNVAIGAFTGYCNTTGRGNNFIGGQAGCSNTTGIYNSFFGTDSGSNNTVGSCNVAIGFNAQIPDGTASRQLAIGLGTNYWLTGDSSANIKPGAGILDCSNSVGSSGNILTSTGSAIVWASGATGSFTSQDGKTVTVTNGIITSIV